MIDVAKEISERILVVDDNTVNLQLVRNVLMPCGYQAMFAVSANRALASIEVSKPDLILLDITMPEINGYELCEILKSKEETRDIPVIFLSALDGDQDVVRGFNLGGVDYVTKPFKEEILLARVKTQIFQKKLKEKLETSNNQLSDEIVKRQNAQVVTQRSERRLSAALSASNEGIWEWLPENKELFFSPTFFTMLGYEETSFEQTIDAWRYLVHPDDKFQFTQRMRACGSRKVESIEIEYRMKTSSGDYIWVMTRGSIIRIEGQEFAAICGTNTNIDQQKGIEHKLKRMVNYDFLTGLPNRLYLNELLNRHLALCRRNHQKMALMFLDLDRFKTVNDSLGHSTGDLLLRKVSERLSKLVREEDAVARLGGDEFTVFLANADCPENVVVVAERIIESFKKPFDIQGHQIVTGPSIGIAIYPDEATSVEDILKKADAAMYKAKRKGGSTFSFYTEDMNDTANNRLQVETDLRQAINGKNMVAHYQLKYNLADNCFDGMETLCRWQNGEELIQPAKFMDVAHETGLILAIDNEVFLQATKYTRELYDKGLFTGRVAINISPLHFKRLDFLSGIDTMLAETGLPPELLELEITEEAIVEDVEHAVGIMNQLKERGVSLALDDFGTGYSSLSYLKRFPIDTLKIDMSFIRDIDKDAKNQAIVTCVINLSHSLNIRVVAEGVETKEQLDFLRGVGCDYIQGYYFCKPVAKKDLVKKIMSRS